MGTKKATDQQILAALRKHGTIMRAARAINIAHQTLRERLSNDPLKTEWRRMRASDVELDLASFSTDVKAARRVLKALMEHGGSQDNIRFASASKLIDTALKLRDLDKTAADDKPTWAPAPGAFPSSREDGETPNLDPARQKAGA
jgi:hypothetical protein